MLMMALISWWYGAGWAQLARRAERRMFGTLQIFSVGLLLQTLFDPFRQISAGQVKGPLDLQMRALVDKFFSRAVGAVVRIIVIFTGLLATVAIGVVGVVQLAVWPVIPFLPVIAIIGGLTRWAL